MRPPKKCALAALSLALCASTASAADIEIRMFDTSQPGGIFNFDPGFVRANVGDTIVFVPTNANHNTSSLLVPDGAQGWKSPFSKELRVTLEKEGIYLYTCDAHKRMGMVGVVQAGNAVNLEEARKKATEESAAMVRNKDRFTRALDQVQ